MPNLSWNFLLPGSGPHTFLWTGSNAYIDNSIIKMSKHTSPSYTYSFEGVEVRLERKNGTSSMEVVKWKLFVDGSYQIATHFTPIGSPRSIWIFLINITSHTITLCHDHSTGRVELTLDSALVSGRKYKIIDSGIKLRFECEGVEGYVWVKPNLFSFRYECVCNGVGLKPCHTMKQVSWIEGGS
ncbi:hypothetical protein TL16_g09714 [Triparma laevis f. inornata]|uniref:Uncharacterized protein n=1 Tax=Triparma laevis f. inornata TaxID=1714386 RepID=A0A9W7B3V8_9STRA|nr:hypothetical protein TL16_g09714 [Triparma laevis f. inornata]